MKNISTLSFLKISCSLIFLGMGLHHLLASQPYAVVGLNTDEIRIFFGILLIVSGLLVFYINRKTKNMAFLLIAPVFVVILNSICEYIDAGCVIEQLVEFATKIFLPLVFFKELRRPTEDKKIQLIMKVIVALTFIGHGAFALGLHYVPGSFILMTESILGLSIKHSYQFLLVIGALDVIFAFLVFFHYKRLQHATFIYLIVWGTLTSLARFVYPIVIEADLTQVSAGFAGMAYRMPHALLPFWLFLRLGRENVWRPQLNKR